MRAKVIDKVHRYSLRSNQDVYNDISNKKYIETGGKE